MAIQKLCTHTFLFDPATTSFQWTKFWCGVYVVEYFGARSVECSFVRSSGGSLRAGEGGSERGRNEAEPSELSLFTPSCTLSARSLTPTRTLFTTLPLYIIRRRGSLSCSTSTLSPSFVSGPTDQAIVLQVQGFETCLVSQTFAISRIALELLGHITFSIIAAFCHPAAAEEWTLLPLLPCLADRKTALYSWLTLNEHLVK